jgi:hypothetical protein
MELLSNLFQRPHVFTQARPEADIEDVFEPELLASILNSCYELIGEQKLTASKLQNADTTTDRLVKQAEAAFRLMPLVPMLDHFAPAAWLIRNPKVLDGKTAAVAKTLDRAEKIFTTFNKLL